MKLKVYKSKLKFSEIKRLLVNDDYKQIGSTKEYPNKSIKISLFFDLHKKSIPDWVEELLIFFDSKKLLKEKYPMQHNAIIVVQTQKKVYLLPKGKAYWAVEKISDLDFGLDFAENAIKSKDILLKSVSYVQRNKMRSITNYKKDQNEFPQASESYFYVSGKPITESIFGSSVDCGTGITFAKNYCLSEQEDIEHFCQLFNEIDNVLILKQQQSAVPRLHKVSKSDDKYNKLNTMLLEGLQSVKKNAQVLLDLNRIQLIGNSLNILENELILKMYISGSKRTTEEEIDLNEQNIIEYLKKNKNLFSNINQIKFALYDTEGNCIKKEMLFSQLIYCEIELDEILYILDNGNWGFFNERFYDLLESKLLEIDKSVKFDKNFNINYDSFENGEFFGEGGYIEKLSKENSMIKLHKRNLSVSKATIEIADIYDKNKDELFAIKRGTDTSLAMYSFEQSLLAVQALAHKKEFQVEKELIKYNDRKHYPDVIRYPTISRDNIRLISDCDCKNTSVLWLIDDKVRYISEGVEQSNFKLNDFKSIMLKLKIVDWYSFTKDIGYNPKLYFALDRPMKK